MHFSPPRRLSASEWRLLKSARTRIMKDSPQAFGDTLSAVLVRTDETWEMWAKRKIYVIESEGSVVAMATWRKTEEDGECIEGVWTDPLYRGRGLNTQLFNQIFTDAKASGVATISLHVNVTQVAAVKAYEKLGFRIVESIKEELMGDGKLYDEYRMEKEV